MNIIFFSHPYFLGSQSLPRFTRMLAEGMERRGHQTEIWSPRAYFYNFAGQGSLKKWLGYVDQYLLFPLEVRKRLKKCAPDTLFVFTDQALGPWIPMVAHKNHIVHCHDFLAQRSALRQIPENPVSWTGRRYQKLICAGYCQGKNFISVSEKTRQDLHQFLPDAPSLSEVVYNGLNRNFKPQDPELARTLLGERLGIDLTGGYLLHVGGNQWYKNRIGVIGIYNAWRTKTEAKLPLLMVGARAGAALQKAYENAPFKHDIQLLDAVDDEALQLAYAGASVFLFPSIAEGFGWPIAEAMASGCPVITTHADPMTEVAGHAAFFIPRVPFQKNQFKLWANEAASVIDRVLSLSDTERQTVIKAGFNNVKRFDPDIALDQIEAIYLSLSPSIKSIA